MVTMNIEDFIDLFALKLTATMELCDDKIQWTVTISNSKVMKNNTFQLLKNSRSIGATFDAALKSYCALISNTEMLIIATPTNLKRTFKTPKVVVKGS